MEYNWQMKGYAFACIRWIDKKKERVRWGWGVKKIRRCLGQWEGSDRHGWRRDGATVSLPFSYQAKKKKLPRFCLG